MKRGFWIILGILIFLVLLMTPFLAARVKNDIILHKYADQLYSLPLPPNTTQIAQNKNVGRLFGLGEHLAFVASVEVKSTLTKEELIQYYKKITIKPACKVSWLKVFKMYFLPNDPVEIKVIPKNAALLEHASSYIIQATDTSYAAGLDMRGWLH